MRFEATEDEPLMCDLSLGLVSVNYQTMNTSITLEPKKNPNYYNRLDIDTL